VREDSGDGFGPREIFFPTHTPRTYPKAPKPTVYVLEFLTFGICLGYVFSRGYVGGFSSRNCGSKQMAVDASVSYGDESPPFWV